MNISINIGSASKEKEILQKINVKHCTINKDEATIIGIYEENKRVHDVYRYTLVAIENTYVLTSPHSKKIIKERNKDFPGSKFRDYYTKNICNDNKTILLIIESPHKDEYTEDFSPIAPAQGVTGDRIDKFLCTILKHNNCKIENGEYNILICNPVQFQTSLRSLYPPKLTLNKSAKSGIKDKVWKKIFEKEKKDFEKRLDIYNPKIVINACTAKLKGLITDIIKERRSILYVANKHPCIWDGSILLELSNKEKSK